MQNQWHENATFTINAIINVNAKTIRTTSFSSSNSSRSWFVLQIWMRASLSFMPSIRSFMPCTVTQYHITNQLTLLQDDIVHYHITDQNMMIPFAPFIIITSVKAEVVQSTALSVCEHDYCNIIIWFHWNLLLWLGRPIGELINFWSWSGPGYGSLFHFPHHCETGDCRRFISISHTVTGRLSWHWCRQGNESTIFWRTSGSKLIQKSGFESQITFGWG